MNFNDIEYWNKYGIKSENRLKEYIGFIEYILSKEDRPVIVQEIHHIVPKSFDSSLANCSWNLIRLSAREHFIAHRILADCFYGEYGDKMVFAFNRMCYSIDYNIISNEYQDTVLIRNHRFSKNYIGSNNPFYGKHHSEESKKRMSISHTGRKNSIETNEKISKSLIGNKRRQGTKQPKSFSEKMKKRMSGSNHPAYGKIGYTFGMKCINNGLVNKMIKSEEVEKYLSNNWKLGRCKIEK